MFTPQELREIRRWHPDEIRGHAEDTLTFMWSPTGGLFAGWPMDHDPTRPGRKLPPGRSFRPNHAEVMMMDPDFDRKFFGDQSDTPAAIKKEPWRQRAFLDQHGLSGRVGRGIVIAGTPRTICGLWPSPNFEQYARRFMEDCRDRLRLQPADIIYPWGGEPLELRDWWRDI